MMLRKKLELRERERVESEIASLCFPCVWFPPSSLLLSQAVCISYSLLFLPFSFSFGGTWGLFSSQPVDRKRQWPVHVFGSVVDFSGCGGYKLGGYRSNYPAVKWTPWENNAAKNCSVCLADTSCMYYIMNLLSLLKTELKSQSTFLQQHTNLLNNKEHSSWENQYAKKMKILYCSGHDEVYANRLE